MIDIIDPVLKSSAESKRNAKTYSFKKFAFVLLIILTIVAAGWIIYIVEISTLDTKPDNTIEVHERIENKELEGRLPPIRN